MTIHQSLGHARTIEQSRVCWSAITKIVPNTLAAIEACSTEEKGTVSNKLNGEPLARRCATARLRPAASRGWKGAFRYTIDLICLPSPCRAGDIRSRPPAAKRGRAMRASLYRMSPVWPRGDKRVTVSRMFVAHWGHSYPQPPFSTEVPFDATSIESGTSICNGS